MANIVQKGLQRVLTAAVGDEYVEKALGGNAKGLLESVDPSAKTQGAATPSNYNTLYRIYKQESWIRACVDAIRRTATASGWTITPAEELSDEQPNDKQKEALLHFFKHPNPEESFTDILDDIYTDLGIYGNAYLEVVKDEDGTPRELWNLDATTVKVKHDKHGYVNGYRQEINGEKADFNPDEVLHFKLVSKGSTRYGLSPIETLIMTVDTDLKAQIYTRKYYENYGAPKGLFKMKNASPEQVRRNRLYLATQVAGIENAHRHLMLEGDVEYQTLSSDFKDTESLKVRRYLRDEMIAVFGVPPSKISIIESGNIGGGTGKSQDKTFKEETVYPLQNKIFDKINFKIIKELFGVEQWEVRPIRENMEDELQRAKIHDIYYKDKAIDTNEIRVAIGLKPRPKEKTPEYIAEQARIREEKDQENRFIENDGERSDKPEGATGTKPGGRSNFGSHDQGRETETAEQKALGLKGKNRQEIANIFSKRLQDRRFLEISDEFDQARKSLQEALVDIIVARVNKAVESLSEVKKSLSDKELSNVLATIGLIFSQEDLAGEVEAPLGKMYEFSWEAAQKALGVEAQPLPDNIKQKLAKESLILSKNISDNLKPKITEEIIEGVNKGEGINELQARVSKYVDKPLVVNVKPSYDGSGTLIRAAHTRTVSASEWARNMSQYESSKMANEALLENYESYGIEEAKWLCTENPCEKCAPHNGRTYKISEIRKLLPYHNECVCTWLPVVR